ncbi:uncharacterized protein [Periplaneta americana]|uniref:uncharacterized protein isoform X1 n=1 Tax=Periplaneta americana TaxID=6978 RepID=UPI0037E95A0C
MDVIKTEPEVDPLVIETSDNTDTDQKKLFSEKRILLDVDMTRIKMESMDNSDDLKLEMAFEQTAMPTDISIVKTGVESEWSAGRYNIEMFGARVISHRGDVQWPPRSPNLNACDYFLWGYLKSRVYQDRPRTIQELKRNIRTEVAATSPNVLQRVMRSLPLRLQECADNDGHHLQNTIFKK